MRLINIDELKGCAIIRPHSREDMKAIKNCSEVIPHNEITTAYDIDNVVEKLEENYSCDVGNLKMISLDKSIEIVKGGAK